jgi:hypothetical protein
MYNVLYTPPETASDEQMEKASRPWFVTYNPFCAPECRTEFHWFSPFPSDAFHPMSPWEDNVIVSHFGIEPFAKSAGYTSVEAYLAKLIEEAVHSSGEPRILRVIIRD